MKKEVHVWYSPRLNKQMPIAVYGHFGFPLLLFPTAAADFEEYERFYLIDVISKYIEEGKVKVYSIDSINRESWMNDHMHPAHRVIRHMQYYDYIVSEVAPFIWDNCRGRVGIITSGASMGAFHAANILFKHPDIFDGTIAMSGSYDIRPFCDGYFDDNIYFNSPVCYLPNLNDDYHLPLLRSKQHIHILTGQGSYEAPHRSVELSEILHSKGIPHDLDLWGYDMPHDWPTWRAMLPYVIATKF